MPDDNQASGAENKAREMVDRPRELLIPPLGVSGLTGVEGNTDWGGINKYSQAGRWSIGNVQSDDDINWFPLMGSKMQTPSNGTVIETLPSPIIWQTSLFLNHNVYLYSLCANGNIYQTATNGSTVSIGTGFTVIGICDIASWQGTLVLISDSVAQKIYSWNGTTLTTVFSAQPVQYIGVFAGRLWMGQNSTIQWTNATTYNSLAGDSGSYIVTDSQCANPIQGFMDVPAGLYVWGANWFKTLTNLVTQGVPAVLTFQQNTLEGNIGPVTKWSVVNVAETIYFATNYGFFRMDGAYPTQISSPNLDGFFTNLDQTGLTSMSAAYGVIASKRCIFWQARYLGDTQVSASYTVFGFCIDSGLWFRFVQGTILWITGIASSAITNNQPTVWGCDGTNIFEMFTNTSSAITSQYNSRLWDFGSALDYDSILSVAIIFIIQSTTTVTVAQLNENNQIQFTPPPVTWTVALGLWINNAGISGNWYNAALTQGSWSGTASSAYELYQSDGVGRVRNLGLNVTVLSSGATLNNLVISYKRTMASKGS
jgi:hypothetical protein